MVSGQFSRPSARVRPSTSPTMASSESHDAHVIEVGLLSGCLAEQLPIGLADDLGRVAEAEALSEPSAHPLQPALTILETGAVRGRVHERTEVEASPSPPGSCPAPPRDVCRGTRAIVRRASDMTPRVWPCPASTGRGQVRMPGVGRRRPATLVAHRRGPWVLRWSRRTGWSEGHQWRSELAPAAVGLVG